MRVLILTWEFPPLVVGGLGRHVDELSRALARAGDDVVVVTRGSTDGLQTLELSPGLRVVRACADPLAIDFATESMLAWTQAFEHSLVRAGSTVLRDWQPDVIHAHDWLVAQTARTLHEACGAPVVTTIHATEQGRQQGWLDNPVSRAIHSIEAWTFQNSAAVIACSRYMAGELGSVFGVPAEAITVIANGIPETAGTVDARARSELRTRSRGDGPLLAFAGRLVHEKGLQELVKALPILAARYPGVRLLVAGDGPLLDAQQDRARRYGVADRVDWLGFVQPETVATVFAAADIAVIPSLYEPFGLVAAEAQAAGVPVAVAEVGGLPELVEPGVTGECFVPESPAAIAAAVQRLVEDPERARGMANTARDITLTQRTWSRAAAQTHEVYAGAIAR